MARELLKIHFKFSRRWGEEERRVWMGKGSWWGHGRERAFSWVWLDHRRSSSGLRDKNLATPVEIWTATTGSQRGLPAAFAEQSSKAAEALASLFGGVGWGVCAWRGQRHACSCHLPGGSLANSVPGWLRPSLSSRREERGEEAWCKRSQLSKRTHRARVGRVSTGLGSTVLSDAC